MSYPIYTLRSLKLEIIGERIAISLGDDPTVTASFTVDEALMLCGYMTALGSFLSVGDLHSKMDSALAKVTVKVRDDYLMAYMRQKAVKREIE